MMVVRKALLLMTFILCGYDVINACTCGGQPSPCQAYASATAVFIGIVKRVEPEKPASEEYLGEQKAYVQVEQPFKGVEESAEVIFHQPGDMCSPKFKAGDRWLMYASYNKKEKTWIIPGCGRSRPAEHAFDDLLYLRGLPESSKRTRLSGVIRHYEDTPEKNFSLIKFIAGAKVKITGAEESLVAFTDSNGVYEVYDLPPGRYTIEPEIPPGLKVRFPMVFGPVVSEGKAIMVELRSNSCAGSDFIVNSNNRITGKVFGVSGEALPNISIDLKPVVKAENFYFRVSAWTKADGSYELKDIPPGNYLIVVNDKGIPSGRQPFSTVYYPGVFDKSRAIVINIEEGDKREEMSIRIPSQLLTRTIQGVLLYADGNPGARERVSFKAEGKDSFENDASAMTDDQGRFSLKMLQDVVGWLRGEMNTNVAKNAQCPEIAKRLKDKGGMLMILETNPIRVEAYSDIQNVELRFSFPFCPDRETKRQ